MQLHKQQHRREGARVTPDAQSAAQRVADNCRGEALKGDWAIIAHFRQARPQAIPVD